MQKQWLLLKWLNNNVLKELDYYTDEYSKKKAA